MSNAIATTHPGAIGAMTGPEMRKVLQNSLYPGAHDDSVDLVLSYCRAAGLDPMLKPVHIVPMWDSKAKRMRDVIMPGIGLYRTQADNTGRFAGQTEPEYGPMITDTIGGVQIMYPEWAKVTVKKLMDTGVIAEFEAKEFWIENYAVKGGAEKSIAPNAMWLKRPRGQIAKCAAAQALRLAFPSSGAQPTAEEMEGKEIDMGSAEVVSTRAAESVELPAYPADKFEANLPTWRKLVEAGTKTVDAIGATISTKNTLSAEQISRLRALEQRPSAAGELMATAEQIADIRAKADAAAIGTTDIFSMFDIDSLEAIPATMVDAVLDYIANPAGE